MFAVSLSLSLFLSFVLYNQGEICITTETVNLLFIAKEIPTFDLIWKKNIFEYIHMRYRILLDDFFVLNFLFIKIDFIQVQRGWKFISCNFFYFRNPYFLFLENWIVMKVFLFPSFKILWGSGTKIKKQNKNNWASIYNRVRTTVF